MILSDRDIKDYIRKGKLVIEGLNEEQIHAGWVELTLGDDFRTFRHASEPFIDIKSNKDYTEKINHENSKPFIIHPGEFVLGYVREKIKLPPDLAAYVDGRSSLGRIGIVVHVTAGFVDPGFSGNLVLEMTNIGKMPVALHRGMRICKLVFFKLSSEAEKPYYMRKDAKYKDQEKVQASMIHKEFTDE